jgi:transposase-like protein
MSSRGPYRRHAPQFKLKLCQDIRSGALGRRDAQKKYSLSANPIQFWLTQFDRGELTGEEVEASVVIDYEAKIAALERKVGQLTMELDLVKKTPRLRLVSDNESSSIASPRPISRSRAATAAAFIANTPVWTASASMSALMSPMRPTNPAMPPIDSCSVRAIAQACSAAIVASAAASLARAAASVTCALSASLAAVRSATPRTSAN